MGIAERRVRREVRGTGPHQLGVVGAEGDDLVTVQLGEREPAVAARLIGRDDRQRVEVRTAGAGVIAHDERFGVLQPDGPGITEGEREAHPRRAEVAPELEHHDAPGIIERVGCQPVARERVGVPRQMTHGSADQNVSWPAAKPASGRT